MRSGSPESSESGWSGESGESGGSVGLFRLSTPLELSYGSGDLWFASVGETQTTNPHETTQKKAAHPRRPFKS